MSISQRIIVLVLLSTQAPFAYCQEEEAKQDLLQALGQLEKSQVSFTTKLTEEQPAAEDDITGVQRFMVSSMNGALLATEFKGDFEVLATKDDLVIVSNKDFPGIKILQSGEKTICIQSHADEPFGVRSLSSTVRRLVNWTELSQALQKSKRLRVTKQGDETSIRVTLDSEFIPIDSPEKEIAKRMGVANVAVRVSRSSSMTPEVVDLTASFVIDSSKELKSAEFTLQFNDPMKSMMTQARRGVAGLRPGADASNGKNDGNVELGKLLTFSFTRSKAPSDRMSEFNKYARELLKKQEQEL